MAMSPSGSFKRIARRTLRIIVKIIVVFFLLIVIVLFLLQTSVVQNFGRKKIQAYLQSKLHTRVEIGGLDVGFPKKIILTNIYLEDLRKDTLLYGGKLELDVNLWKLLKHTIVVKTLTMDQFTVKVKRVLPDTGFNYDFIAKAFASDSEKETQPIDTAGAWQFELGKIHLTKISTYYMDDASGNEARVYLGDFETNIKIFDLTHKSFSVPEIVLSGVRGNLRQYKPLLLLKKVADTVQARSNTNEPVTLQLGNIRFQSLNLDYSNQPDSVVAKLNLGLFTAAIQSVDLKQMKVGANKVSLENTVVLFNMGKRATTKAKQNTNQTESNVAAPWKFELTKLNLVNDAIEYNDEAKVRTPASVDLNHIKASSIHLDAASLEIGSDGYRGKVNAFSFLEQSGFQLRQLSTGFAYSDTAAKLTGLVVRTNRSVVEAQAQLSYSSLPDISKKPGSLYTDLHFDHSSIAVKDLLLWAPALTQIFKGNESTVLRLNGRVFGHLSDLTIPDLELAGWSHTDIRLAGHIKGLPSGKKAIYTIQLKKFVTSRRDIEALVPAKSLPQNIRIPDQLSASGQFNGRADDFNIKLLAKTSIGSANVNGHLNIPGKTYDLTAALDQFNLGYLLKQDSILGPVSLVAKAKGQGFDYKTLSGSFDLAVKEAMYNDYKYKDLSVIGHLQNGIIRLDGAMDEPDLGFKLNATGNVSGKYPSILMDLEMDTLNLHALHFVQDTMGLHFNMHADFANTNPDALQGKLYVLNMSLDNGHQLLTTDSLSLTASRQDSIQDIHLLAKFADIDWIGQYRLTEVASSIKQTLNRYWHFEDSSNRALALEHWKMIGRVNTSPVVLSFLPALKGTDTIHLQADYNSALNDFQFKLQAHAIQYNDQKIHALDLSIATKDTALNYALHFADAGRPGFQLYESSISGWLANNQLVTSLLLNDSRKKERYFVSTNLKKNGARWRLSLNPDSLLLNYDKWNVSKDNFLLYDSSNILVHHLKLDHQDESMLVNSTSLAPKAPMNIEFANFDIKTITSFAEQDSLSLDGQLNGKIEIRDLLHNPVFTSDLTVHELAYKKDTLGNLVIKIDNEKANAFSAKASLLGRHNDVSLDGIYYTGESKMDLNIVLRQLNLSLIKPISGGQIKEITGYLKGNIKASGNLTTPTLRGTLQFDSTYITPTISGERLKLAPDPIEFDEDGINFSQFAFLDSAGNKATLDGNIYTKNFKQYRFDLSFSADNFRLINAPKTPNSLVYGRLNLDADIDVVGDLESPKINADFRVNKQTDLTFTLPSNDPEIVERRGVVVFVDQAHPTDSVRLKTLLDSLSRRTELKGMDVAATIETDSNALFTMIIDERNGDALGLRGRADLVAGIDRSGKVTLTGNYELENGSYNLSLSVLKRKFVIQRGSTITWTGDPRTANIDITATYLVNAPSIDLVQQQLSGRSQTEINRFKQKLPFRVNLRMQGELLKPIISFSISLPPDQLTLWPEVDNKLQQIKTDESEVNKQVFALLLLNRFVSENPFVSAAGGTDAETLAKQSASKILSDQVNQLAASLIKGVELNVDLNSDKDYSSGQAVSQTQLNVGVSKNLFSDRVRVSVGSNFQLEQTNPGQNASNIVGDVNVDYRLTSDGRYMIRAYRKDQYTSVVEGQVVETGLSFILTFDYNEFFELFRKSSDPKPKANRKAKKNSDNSKAQP